MNTEDQILIEKQLRAELTTEEQILFLDRLDNDADFRQAYALEKQLQENLNESDWSFINNQEAPVVREYTELFRSEETAQLAAMLSDVSREHQSKQLHNPKNRLWIWYSGVAATLLVGLMTMLFLLQPKSTETLYAEYFDPSDVPASNCD
ncbi:MAG: hypothetical protein AAFO69_10910 [Bacteroidota bacterium]